ncbi:MAG: 16S rRNA (guanine(966)-N(2))-methyltransferase RsmD [Bacteroidales bacterium]|nr:16S rRNA (guanine(966)-N(2))-methyltransferase RsmD [Bacteroidales bacterium]
MRIIGGHHKGRRISPPVNLPVRPTTDLAKESLFNILNNLIDFENLRVLDLFAGTGNISFEFASRQAALVTAIDLNFKCVEFIKKTAMQLDLTSIRAFRADVFKLLGKSPTEPYDLIFSDAPYEMNEIKHLPDLIFEKKWLNKDGLLIIEHPRGIDFADHPQFSQNRHYGKVNFTFFTSEG